MDKANMVTYYSFELNTYKNIHSAGPDIYFYSPCIGYIKKGYAKFLHNGKTLYAYEGDLIYIAYGTRYQSIWYGSPDIEWYSINFEFGSKYAYCDYRFQIIKNYPQKIFDKMYSSYKNEQLLSVSHLYKLLNDIYSRLEATPKSSLNNTVMPAIDYIEKNYSSQIDINSLAKLCNLSESGFFKQFKKATGVTPITYKHNIMIQYAVDLLTNTNLTIEQISNQVGFSSTNYFRKVFCGFTDKTPKDFRQK